MPYQVSMMVGLGRVKTFVVGLGWVVSRNFGLGWILKKWPMTNSGLQSAGQQ